ncbi:MAG: hypothetical protein AAFU54_24930 [Chloroflexota bacterium]
MGEGIGVPRGGEGGVCAEHRVALEELAEARIVGAGAHVDHAVAVGHLPVVAERGAGVAGAIGDALAVGRIVGVRGESAAVHESAHIAGQVMSEVAMLHPGPVATKRTI